VLLNHWLIFNKFKAVELRQHLKTKIDSLKPDAKAFVENVSCFAILDL
jgi:hypothetical protein